MSFEEVFLSRCFSSPARCWLVVVLMVSSSVVSRQVSAEEAGSAVLPTSGSTYVTVSADRLELDPEAGTVRGEGLRLSSCGSCAPPWTVSARRAVLQEDGDIDLVLPVLRLGRVPVFALPWLRVRTARRWGLLLPRLGARAGGGFEIGLGLWVPLGPRYELSVTASYLTELVGAEVVVELTGDDVDLRVLGQAGAEGFGSIVEGLATYRTTRSGESGATTSMSVQLDWSFDPEMARLLTTSIEDEARNYEVSSLAVVRASRHLQASLITELLHELPLGAALEYFPLAELSFNLLPVDLGPIWLSMRQSTRAIWAVGEGREPWAAWHTALEPRLTAAFALGPVATRLTVASVLTAWPGSVLGTDADGRGLVIAGVDLAVPLVKTSGRGRSRRRHLVEPSIRYRLAVVDTQHGGSLEMAPLSSASDRFAWPVAGNLLWFQLRGVVQSVRSGFGVRAVLGQLLSFDGLAGERVPPRLEGRLELDVGLAEVWLTVSLDERTWTVGEAWSRALIGSPEGHGVEVDWRWLSEGSRSLSGPDLLAVVPLLVPWDAAMGGHTIGGRVWTTIRGAVRLEADTWLDLEHRSLIRVGGGLEYSHRCGCLSAAVRAWYRPWRRWPDVMVTVNLGGL